MFRSTFLPVLALAGWMLLCSGIRRHDVPEEKYLQLAAEPQFDCVGSVFAGRKAMGSCVLIGERYVLTAAHVVFEGSRAISAKRISFRFNGSRANAKTITVHPGYSPSGAAGHCDLALIELDEPVTDIVTPRINAHFDEAGSYVTGVGFGASGPADKPEKIETKEQKTAGQNIVDSLTGDFQGGRPSLMMIDFDHPVRTDCNRSGSPVPQSLEYINAGGDSGGGLFRQTGDGWELIGICSGGGVDAATLLRTGYYGQAGIWTRVSVFRDWMDGIMEQAP